MRTAYIDTDEAVTLHITATAGRTFDLTLDLHRPLDGEGFRLQVRDWGGALILSFKQDDGTLNLDGSQVLLAQTHTAMQVPTGVWQYDLVEEADGRFINCTRGNFIIKPGVTQ